MNIKYIISGVVFLVLGILLLVWLIGNPFKYKEGPNEKLGADDLYLRERMDKAWNRQGIVGFVIMIIFGLVLIYEGITGVRPF